MGCVCSAFASCLMWTGELLENLILALAEIGVVVLRGVIAVLVSLCDLLASCACCCRVPYDERPDRDTYTYATVMKPSAVQWRRGLLWWATKQGRMEVRQEKQARRRQRELEIEERRQARKAAKEKQGEAAQGAEAQEAAGPARDDGEADDAAAVAADPANQ